MADFDLKAPISITCPKRITKYLVDEVKEFGFPVLKERTAGIETEGTLNDCMKLNLSLRTAHRVLYRIDTFTARDVEQLFKSLKGIPWEEYIDKTGYVTVHSAIKNNAVDNTQFANMRVKDAIVDRIRDKTGLRPDSGPEMYESVVFLFWKGSQAQIYLDTSGESLSRRGYRTQSHTAPLQESLAASILKATKWEPGQYLINPMCGSGTIAIEGALMALDKAPGLLRPNYAIKHILGFDKDRWEQLRADLKNESKKSFDGQIICTDRSVEALNAAKKNAQTAGVEHLLKFERCDFKNTTLPDDGNGIIVLNPPYGERLGNTGDLGDLYKSIGDFFKQKGTGYWGYVFTGNQELAKRIGLRTNQKIKFYNSTIDARLLEYELY